MIIAVESVVLCLLFTLMVYILSREPIKTGQSSTCSRRHLRQQARRRTIHLIPSCHVETVCFLSREQKEKYRKALNIKGF